MNMNMKNFKREPTEERPFWPGEVFVCLPEEKANTLARAMRGSRGFRENFWAAKLKAGKINQREFDFIVAPEPEAFEIAAEMLREKVGASQPLRFWAAEPAESGEGVPSPELLCFYLETVLNIWAKCGLIEMKVATGLASA